MYSVAVMCKVLYMSVRFILSTVLFKSSVSLLIFCVEALYIIEIPYNYYVVLYFSSQFCDCLLLLLGALMLGAYVFIISHLPWELSLLLLYNIFSLL